ncbi:MAG: class I SAM-dependent methyltransferase [Prolixibacteraceae bacterium]|nr:class I SAM-dependent methyltransferase [Burkholderiales bacterium]
MNTNIAEQQHVQFDALRVRRVVERVFRGYTGSLDVRLWDGIVISLGRDSPVATIVVHTAKLLRELAWRRPDPLRLAKAYISGEIDVEGDLYALLKQRIHLQSLTVTMRDRLALFSAGLFPCFDSALVRHDNASVRWPKPFQTRTSRKHSKAINREAIAFHYDVSNEFYRLWLDEQMVYSCAYFNDPGESLDQAQRNKLEHICRKLRLKAGERLLDIGCGWGALICWAAQHYGVRAHGITLSRQQYEYTQTRIRDLGIEKQVTVELRDYRDLPNDAAFDKVSSIGMFEHVGLKNLPAYFRAVGHVLKPGGLFLNHGITDNEEGRHETVGTEFIQRYVFPDSELDSVSNVQRVMERTGFEIWDVEALRPHYALTLRRWLSRLEAQREEAHAHVSEARYRVWRLYMAGCAVQFERGSIGVYQILAANRREGFVDVPLTRHDIYQ